MTYRPEFQARTSTFDVRVERAFNYLLVEGDLYVYKLCYTHILPDTAPIDSAGRFQDYEDQGFAQLESIKEFLAGNAGTPSKGCKLVLTPEGFLEMAQSKGYVAASEYFEKALTYKSTPKPYDSFVQADIPASRVVHVDCCTHMLFDINGDVLPTAMYFDYMHGQMDEATYDLDLAIKVLSGSPRITPIDPGKRRGGTSKATLQYYDIPYYNSEPGRSRSLPFIFSPTRYDMLKLWEKCNTYSPESPAGSLHRAVFNLDMLGLRAAGAAKFVNFYSTQTA